MRINTHFVSLYHSYKEQMSHFNLWTIFQLSLYIKAIQHYILLYGTTIDEVPIHVEHTRHTFLIGVHLSVLLVVK